MCQAELHIDRKYYSKQFPSFERPNIIGYINLNNLKYATKLQNDRVSFDLNLHLDKVKRKPDDLDVKLNDLLKFLLQHEGRLNIPLTQKLDDSYFFCYRGLMTCVACTPYEYQEPWKIIALLYKGHIYLCARDTEEKIKKRASITQRDKQFASWGYKFEQYMLADSPDSEPNPDVPVDETEEFSLVFKTHLNKHKIVYGAEMDGIRCDKKPVSPLPDSGANAEDIIQYLSTKEFIELKTSRHIETPRQAENFKKFKSKKWWCQSFLVGIDTILCGFRDDSGIVEELEMYHVNYLPKMSKKFWDPNVCFNFLEAFFTFVKRCLARKIKAKHGPQFESNIQKLPLISLVFEWRPGSPVTISDNYCHEEDPILLDWFLENFQKHHETG